MTKLESSLRKTLEEHPEDWPMRLLIADKALERNAREEAAQLLLEAPAPPSTEVELQRLVEIAEEGGIELVNQFVLKYPRSVYGHQLLGTILEWIGKKEESHEHFAAAKALGAALPELQPIQGGGGLNIPVVELDEEAEGSSMEAVEPDQAVEDGVPSAAQLQVVSENQTSETPPVLAEPIHEIEESVPPAFVADPVSDNLVEAGKLAASPFPLANEAPVYQEMEQFTLEDLAPVEPPKQRGKKATAVMAALIFHFVVFLIAALVVILPPAKDDPEIVAAILPMVQKKQEMQKKNVVKQTKKTSASAAAAAPLAQLMRANAVAKISLPNVTKTSKGPLGIGDADFGGGGFGSGSGGMGSGASFFGGAGTGRRFLFVLDHSGSMKKNQVQLRNNELEKALKSLRGVEYQVLLFAGGGYFATKGWSVRRAKGLDNVVTGPSFKCDFKSVGGYADYSIVGGNSKLPKAKWLFATPSNIQATMAKVKKDPLYGGTDWGLALDIAHLMSPPPDVIFFMADGTGGNSPGPILKTNSKYGRPPINMVAMQTTAGINQFAEIAKKTRGNFTIVDKQGKPIDGFDFLRNPSRFKGRL